MSRQRLILALCGCLIALLLQARPSGDVDVFWQLKLGQLALEQGRLIRSDPFTATHGGESVAPVAWLSQILYYGIYRIGSWRLLHQTNALVFAGGLLLASWTARGRGQSALAGILGLSLGFLVAAPHCEIRPQTFALFCFAAVHLLAEAEVRPWRRLVLAAAVLVFWQNAHPSVLLGAAVLGARAGAGWLGHLRGGRAAKPWSLTMLCLIAVLSSVATPLGPGVFEISRRNAAVSRQLGISEWMPLWNPAAWDAGAWIVWLALGVSLVLAVRVRRVVRREDLAAFLVLAAMSLLVYRLSLFLAAGMIPVWSRWIQAAWYADSPSQTSGQGVRPWLAWGAVAAGLLCALPVPRLLHWRVFDEPLPFAAVKQIRQIGVRGTIYNYREWGGLLIWEGYPDWKVTIDGRLYLFGEAEWDRYRAIASGRVPVAEVERLYGPDAFFLRPTHDRNLVALLQESSRWQEAYADRDAIVFVRR